MTDDNVSIGVGDGLLVHGTVQAIIRVQMLILLKSKHPVESTDVRAYLTRELGAAEAKLVALREQLRQAGIDPAA